jgi:hypothetical protein
MRADNHLLSEAYLILLTPSSHSGPPPLILSVLDLPNTGPADLFSIFFHNCS